MILINVAADMRSVRQSMSAGDDIFIFILLPLNIDVKFTIKLVNKSIISDINIISYPHKSIIVSIIPNIIYTGIRGSRIMFVIRNEVGCDPK